MCTQPFDDAHTHTKSERTGGWTRRERRDERRDRRIQCLVKNDEELLFRVFSFSFFQAAAAAAAADVFVYMFYSSLCSSSSKNSQG